MSELSLTSLPVPMSVVLGLTAAAIYLVGSFRRQRGGFSILDTMIVMTIMFVVTAGTAPIMKGAAESAQTSALQQNLRHLRQQIELYKLDHDGKPPVLFKGGFPQLGHATNSEGLPGPRGPMYPHGPYLPGGLPVNPCTGSSLVQAIDEFPPTKPTGQVGWLYHQETGRIAPDLAE